MTKNKAQRRFSLNAISSIWQEHTHSFKPDLLVNEVHPRTVFPVLIGVTALLLAMYFVPQIRQYTEFDHPWIPIVILCLGGFVTFLQWISWNRQYLVQILCLIDNSLYCLAVVAIMVDTVSPVRYVWGLLYAQMAAHYGGRYAFSWPLLVSISLIPLGATLYFCNSDYGLIALTLFGALMFVVNSTTTRHARKLEHQKNQYQSAYILTDKVATKSLDIAIATSLAEVGNFLHELRNIKTPVIGNLMLLKEHENLHPEIKESVAELERCNSRSTELIEKLLASIKKRTEVRDTSFFLPDILNKKILCSTLSLNDAAKVFLKDRIPSFEIQGNFEHFKAAIGNLIQNALNAGADHISLSATCDGGLQRVTILVADNGPGIPEDRRNSLFTLNNKTNEDSTHGLGLPLSKRFVEILGGSLTLVKTDNNGTVFEIVIIGTPVEIPVNMKTKPDSEKNH